MPTVMGESRYVVIAQFNVTLPNWLICRMAIFAPLYVLFRHRGTMRPLDLFILVFPF